MVECLHPSACQYADRTDALAGVHRRILARIVGLQQTLSSYRADRMQPAGNQSSLRHLLQDAASTSALQQLFAAGRVPLLASVLR